MAVKENGIDWYVGDKLALGYFSGGPLFTKIKQLAKKNPEVEIDHVNPDGSFRVKFPVSWIKITPPRTKVFSKEELERRAELINQKFNED